mmetsp:Transcript_2254/g.5639  ORF Transcript_2254/g.5639 Transcript_2254/m.5639 type:complete len:206 (+) Transcript_2254:323-940(+)
MGLIVHWRLQPRRFEQDQLDAFWQGCPRGRLVHCDSRHHLPLWMLRGARRQQEASSGTQAKRSHDLGPTGGGIKCRCGAAAGAARGQGASCSYQGADAHAEGACAGCRRGWEGRASQPVRVDPPPNVLLTDSGESVRSCLPNQGRLCQHSDLQWHCVCLSSQVRHRSRLLLGRSQDAEHCQDRLQDISCPSQEMVQRLQRLASRS